MKIHTSDHPKPVNAPGAVKTGATQSKQIVSEELAAAWPAHCAAMSIKDFSEWIGIGRSTFYNIVNAGELRPKKIGRKTVILRSDALRWLENLPSANRSDGGAS
ncbi:MAG: helix-turn-helix domain-containing protein [Pseudomonadota bacterium]